MQLNDNNVGDALSYEKALVSAAQAGDQQAFELLVSRYNSVLNLYARTYSSNQSDIDDFVQEGLCGLLKAVRTYDGRSSAFSTYASVCIKNGVISAARKYGRQQDRLVSYEESVTESDVPTQHSPETIIIDKESTAFLYRSIQSVLSKYEAVVFEMYLSEMPYATMAELLGKPVKSVENAVRRIRTKIKNLITT